MKKIFSIILLSLVGLFSGCNWIDTSINVDPDSPSDVPLNMLLPSIESSMAYSLGGNDCALTTNVWMQYFNGFDRQMQAIAKYNILPSDPNNFWSSVYYDAMMDCKVMIDKATESNAFYYKGIAQINMAMNLSVLTDLFGDVPYTEAFQGAKNLEPKVDTQEAIYQELNKLLDDAIANLNNSGNTLAVTGDMIFGGDASKWIMTAYALKARFALALSERTGSAAYTAALAALPNAYSSNEDNYAFLFGTDATSLSPITQFCDQRGYITMGKYFIDLLQANADPRLEKFSLLSENGDYVGGAPASSDFAEISLPGEYINNKAAAIYTYFMTYAECKFIEAEAKFQTGDKAGAAEAYIAAVSASIDQVGVDGADWLAANINGETAGTITLEKIMTQKYIAGFGQTQSYNDYRRTNLPAGLLTPATATIEMPRRYPYAQDEITYNSNIEALWQNTVFLSTHVWWDAN